MISTILCEKCLYSELFWSAFSCIRTEYGEIFRISPYFVRMWENADQNNSEYEHFLRSSNWTRQTTYYLMKVTLKRILNW